MIGLFGSYIHDEVAGASEPAARAPVTQRHRCGLVPLSADPVTFGHLDVIAHASTACDTVVVFIGNSDDKLGRYCFSLAERVAMAEQAIRAAGLTNVRVIGSDGLLVDLYLREGCDAIFRGVRNTNDRSGDDAQMALQNIVLPGIADRVEYVPARPERALISSTMVKAFVAHDLDVSRYVPVAVKQALEERITQRCLVGVTGGIAVGKSTVTTRIAEYVRRHGRFPVTVIDVDQLQRDLYTEDSPGAQLVRDELAKLLGPSIRTDGGRGIDREQLARMLFRPDASATLRGMAHAIVAPHVERKFREAIRGCQGLVLIEWAQLIEMELTRWVNHHVIVVESPNRDVFAAKRGITPQRLMELRAFQWDTDRKVRELTARIAQDQHGHVFRFVNRRGATNDVRALVTQLIEQFPFLHGQNGGS